MEYKPIPNRDVKEISEAGKIARFYGFKPLIPPTIEKQDFEVVKNFNDTSYPAEKAALLRMYIEEKMMSLPQPNMFFCERPFHGNKEKKKSNRLEATLVSLGSLKSVCECLSIQASISILKKIGHKNIAVEVNSVGDKDSTSEFQRKLSVYIKKSFNSFSADLRQAIKKDLFAVLKENREEWQQFQAECPKSIDFLSETSRIHFKEVLEFLEILEIPYQINHHLVGDPDIGSETIFAIKNESGEELAFGFRFNRMAKKIGHKKDLPATFLNISARLKKPLTKTRIKPVKPDFYLIQFGPEAKLKSFLVLEEIYKTGANVIHSMAKDKMISQIGVAENSGALYIILIGQKEALENSVVIRNTSTRAQQIIPIHELASKIKGLI